MKNNLNEQLPFVTVIAPCRNEEGFTSSSVGSILAGDYPADHIEVLIVDGMGDDGTRDIVRKMGDKDERIRMLDNPQKIVPSAKTIVLNYSGWHRDLIEEAKAGFGCQQCDLDEFIDKALYLNSNRQGLESVGQNARLLAEKEFDRQKLAMQVMEVIVQAGT